MAIEGLYLGNDRLLDIGVTPIYIKDIISDSHTKLTHLHP